jgi:predicted lipoprotein with Yx(FWY)xxD motif
MTQRAPTPLRAAIFAFAAVLLLAACRSAGVGSPSAVGSAESAAVVALAESAEVGEHLVDAQGRTLYIFLNDSPGTSACSGECATNWPPATVEEGQEPAGGDGVTGELSTIERDDGTLQLTVEGWPLYLYAADTEPGDTKGEGVGGVWFVGRPDASLPDAAGDASAEPSADGSMGDENPDDYY